MCVTQLLLHAHLIVLQFKGVDHMIMDVNARETLIVSHLFVQVDFVNQIVPHQVKETSQTDVIVLRIQNVLLVLVIAAAVSPTVNYKAKHQVHS